MTTFVRHNFEGLNNRQLFDTLTEALDARGADEESDEGSDSEESSAIEGMGSTSLPETIKDALRVSEEVEWTRDLVLLKWHGVFAETHGNGGDENSDSDDGFEADDDDRKQYWIEQRTLRLS